MHATLHAPQPATDLNRWIADLGTALARASQPDPVSPGADYRTGTRMLAFAVEPDGGITDIRVVGSSGDESLDRRAVAKLRRADPLPAGPLEATRRAHVIVMQVAERVRAAAPRIVTTPERAYA